MEKELGQPVVLSDNPRRRRHVAASIAATEKPDGYSLFHPGNRAGGHHDSPADVPSTPHRPHPHRPLRRWALRTWVSKAPPSRPSKSSWTTPKRSRARFPMPSPRRQPPAPGHGAPAAKPGAQWKAVPFKMARGGHRLPGDRTQRPGSPSWCPGEGRRNAPAGGL